ncbi:hypothetical protein NEOLEDRAFT_1143656 [Neolentinus lepideus HHB14362 ss-1]|uniref:Uncharacterized protein n=1 Tax=Neolentinus lepideus HHB14362 ss-1 TaxID=1314782 RepID=A0A165ME72_9AGAM|nr:hypothetical protein NEOLEDRAFT_1143656 [Neolentinus lepideus HHB14362 ss-1]
MPTKTSFAQCSAPESSRPKIIVMTLVHQISDHHQHSIIPLPSLGHRRPSIHCASQHPLDFCCHHLAEYAVPVDFLGFQESGTPSNSGHSLRQ